MKRIFTDSLWCERLGSLFCIVLLCALIFVEFAHSIKFGWHTVFDDAFISFRYARNLAEGYGITWNANSTPVEGYTNFLLVVFLAPFIWLGASPLAVTRVCSYAALAGISFIVYRKARVECRMNRFASFLISSIPFLVPEAKQICLLGLETVIYSFFLLVSLQNAIKFLDVFDAHTARRFAIFTFLTALLRPEVVILFVIVACLGLVRAHTKGLKFQLRPLVVASSTFVICVSTYLLWKFSHFGSLLPNPYYLKAATSSFFVRRGLESVTTFLVANTWLIFFMFLASVLGVGHRDTANGQQGLKRYVGPLLSLFMILFFMRVDTLMDFNGRFLFPLIPIVVYAGVPCWAFILESALNTNVKFLVRVILTLLFVSLFNSKLLLDVYGKLSALYYDQVRYDRGLMLQEYRIAKNLAKFKDIRGVRVAFGDAGVIPYFTQAQWLDFSGLNDRFIATHKNLPDLVNYVFEWNPDLIITASNKNLTWVGYGHGGMGNFPAWAQDPRWDDFIYVATTPVEGPIYDLQYFIRKGSRFYTTLAPFIREHVAEGWYTQFPIQIGTYTPLNGAAGSWVSRGGISSDIN